MRLPLFLKKYFWDIDFDTLSFRVETPFIIARILEYGDIKALRWLFKNVDREQIKEVVLKSREISPKTANFWSLLLNLDRNQVLCLKRSYQKMRKNHWIY